MPSFLKMVDQTRLNNYLGLKMVEGFEFKKPGIASRDYAYIEIPAAALLTQDGESLTEAKRNQAVKVYPACTVNVKGSYRFEVQPNPKLWDFGAAQGSYYLEPEEGLMTPTVSIWLRRDMNLSDLEYAIRIYMRE